MPNAHNTHLYRYCVCIAHTIVYTLHVVQQCGINWDVENMTVNLGPTQRYIIHIILKYYRIYNYIYIYINVHKVSALQEFNTHVLLPSVSLCYRMVIELKLYSISC